MNKPFWQIKNEWMIEDIKFEIFIKIHLLKMLMKHPDDDDPIRLILLEMLKTQEKNYKKIVDDYKKVYGDRPNIKLLRMEVENEINSEEQKRTN